MVAGLINSGISLGAMTGPLLSGIIIDALSYVWTLTILAFAYLLMVSIFLRSAICTSPQLFTYTVYYWISVLINKCIS